jgi:hypothetical protein
MCNTIYIVPSVSSASIEPSPSVSQSRWYMRTPEQQVYGPVSYEELGRWATDRRISADCELRTDEGAWRPAGEFFAVSPPARVASSATRAPSHQTPHRGALILILGILGWTMPCFPLGVVAWVMGNSDRWEMESGRMDSSGRGLTEAGRILGMIQTILCLIAFLIVMFVAVFIGLLSV